MKDNCSARMCGRVGKKEEDGGIDNDEEDDGNDSCEDVTEPVNVVVDVVWVLS